MIRKWMAPVVVATCCLMIQVTTVAADGVAGCCPDAGCTKTVCRPVCETKTVTKRVYAERTEEFCLPCSFLHCLFPSKCGCSHVRTRKLLILKLQKCEVPVKKCVPVQVPACTTCAPACSAPCATCAPTAPAYLQESPVPTVISIPTMPAVMPSGK